VTAAVLVTTTTIVNEANDTGLTTAANWVGIVTGAIVFAGLLWVFWQWLRWRNPVSVRFLIPRAQYVLKTFPGAPSKETSRRALTIGVGAYDVIVEVKAKIDLDITQIRVLLDERGEGARPRQLGVVPSRLSQQITADHRGRHRYVDWNGEVKVSEDFEWPRFVHKDDTCLVTQRLRTFGDWAGTLVVVIGMRGERFARSRTYKLDLAVSEERNEAPYLQSPPTHEASLHIVTAYDYAVVVRFGVGNPQQQHIGQGSLNFRVPDYAVELAPSDEHGNLLPNPAGSLGTSSEVLEDKDGIPHGVGIKYWNRTGIDLPGRMATIFDFRVSLDEKRASLPVRVTLVSPDLDDPIEFYETLYPDWPMRCV
jgi:hypothetical protein